MINTQPTATGLDIEMIRSYFPVLTRKVKGKDLIYFDNAATTQKPKPVIDALVAYYSTFNANIHRGIHSLAEEATAAFESTRDKVKEMINAEEREEIIFTRGATEGINLVAQTWGRKNLQKGDEVIISNMEHHSNIVPWQLICEEKGALLKVIPVNDRGELIMEEYDKLLTNKTKLVAVVHVSNSLGIVNPVSEIIEKAHQTGAKVLLDGAQSTVHLNIDVKELDCDFFVLSAHKYYGPTGFGILYGKRGLLEAMPVYHGGGEMIKEVSFEKTTYNDLPYKFEAGTPNIADAIAFKTAIEFVEGIGKESVRTHEKELMQLATNLLQEIPGVRIIGESENKISLVSFVIDKIHPQDIGILLDNAGVAVRTGHHCTQPLMDRFKIAGTIRASFAMYNTTKEVEVMIEALKKAIKILT